MCSTWQIAHLVQTIRVVFLFIRFIALRPSQQLWSLRDGLFL